MYWTFTKDKPYFVVDPEGDGVVYFETEEARDEYAERCILKYVDVDGWDDQVTNVVSGVIQNSAQITMGDNFQDYDEDHSDIDDYQGESLGFEYRMMPI